LPGRGFWPDSVSYADADLDHVRGHRQVTGAYLASLVAGRPGSSLATFDGGLGGTSVVSSGNSCPTTWQLRRTMSDDLQRPARRVRDTSRMTTYRVLLVTDLTRLDEDGLDDLLERLVEIGGVPAVPSGVLEVTGSTTAADARTAVDEVARVLDRALQAMNRPYRVVGVQAGEVGPHHA
jgi:hypothetical protein